MTVASEHQTGQISDEQLRDLIGPERFASMDEYDDGAIPTVVVEPQGGNVFLHFKERSAIEHLINQLADVLAANNPSEMTVRVSGSVQTFRDTCVA